MGLVELCLILLDLSGQLFDSVRVSFEFVIGAADFVVDFHAVFLHGGAVLFEFVHFIFEFRDAEFDFVGLHIGGEVFEEGNDVARGAGVVGESDAVHVAVGDHEGQLRGLVFFLPDGDGGEVDVVAGLAESAAGLVLIHVVAFLGRSFHVVLVLELVGKGVGDDVCRSIVHIDGEAGDLFFAEHGDRLVYSLRRNRTQCAD